MPALVSRAQDIAAHLTAAGLTPRIKRYRDHIRIEADMPDNIDCQSFDGLLAAFGRSDRFGMEGSADKRTAWAVVERRPGERPPASGS